jgi:hypothetical protein
MAYSCSAHFTDQKIYKILFNPRYGLGDMIFTRYKHLQQFSEKEKHAGTNWAGPALSWAGSALRQRRELRAARALAVPEEKTGRGPTDGGSDRKRDRKGLD